MAFKIADRVRETTTSTGTGDLTLAGAVPGFSTFASRLAVGDTALYAAVLGTQWEVGLGTLTAATTLARTTVLASSNGDAAVNFAAGSKDVFLDAPASLLASFLRFDAAQGLTAAQQAQARANAGVNSAGALSFRNRIRNGGFTVNRRGVSGTVALAAGVYGHDGFKAGANGCTYTFSKNNGITTLNITAGTLLQVIEGALYVVEGGTYTASWIGTAPARVYQGSATGAYAAGPLTVLGLAAETNTAIEWSTGTLTLPQFEPGTAATTFERRDDEGFRNLRYQQPIAQMDGIFINSTLWYGVVKAVPDMAFTPTLVLLNGANALNEYQGGGLRNASSFANPLYTNTGGDLFLNTSTANSGARATLTTGAAVMRAEF